MKYKFSKFISVLLILSMIPNSVYAQTLNQSGSQGDVAVLVDAEEALFSVTVPTSLPVYVNSMGKVTTSTETYIRNNSPGPVKVESADVTAVGDWQLMDYDNEFGEYKVNDKKFGLNMQGGDVSSNGETDMSGFSPISGGGTNYHLDYDAKVVTQLESLSLNIANVVFTVGWDSTDPSNTVQSNNLRDLTLNTTGVRTEYEEGENFDTDGLTVTVNYNDSTPGKVLSPSEYSVVDGNSLNVNQKEVTVMYKNEDDTVTGKIPITVTPKDNTVNRELKDIVVSSPPNTKTYKVGSTFDKTGMVVKAVYDNLTTKVLNESEYTVLDGSNLQLGTNKVTIQYQEDLVTKTVEVPISVVEEVKELESIEVSSSPSKTEYKAGDDFNSSGLEITANYSDGSESVIGSSSYSILNGTNLKFGQTSVTIEYREGNILKSTEVFITVSKSDNKVLDRIEVVSNPSKTTYIEGEDFEPDGMIINAYYQDGSNEVISSSDYVIEGGTSLKQDDTNVVIKYTVGDIEKSVVVNITVKPASEKTLDHLEIKTQPTKTEYNEGDNFEVGGMVVEAVYSDGSREEISSGEYTVLDGTNLTSGKNTVTIQYKKDGIIETITVNITVNPATKTLQSIAVTTPPNKTVYNEGDNFDYTGMVVTAYYSDGSNSVIDFSDYTISDGSNLKQSQSYVTISYQVGSITKTTTTPITVNEVIPEKTLNRIEITTPPNKIEYNVGDNFDKTGMVVTAFYSDGSSNQIFNYTVPDGAGLQLGTNFVTISYEENSTTKTVTQNITVSEKAVLDSITITKQPTNTIYLVGSSFNSEGMEVTAHYTGGKEDTVVDSYTVVDGENLQVEDTFVTIQYEEGGVTKEVTQTIEVITDPKFNSLSLISGPTYTDYYEGEMFSTHGIEIEANYIGGESKRINRLQYTIVNGEDDLTTDVSEMKIEYSEDGVKDEISIPITVSEAPKKLPINVNNTVLGKYTRDAYIVHTSIVEPEFLSDPTWTFDKTVDVSLFKDESVTLDLYRRGSSDTLKYAMWIKSKRPDSKIVLGPDASYLFKKVVYTTALRYEVDYIDLTNIDTSNVTDMSYFFTSCNFIGDGIIGLEDLNTFNVIDTSSMFQSVKINSLDLSNFRLPNVINMSSMFKGFTCESDLCFNNSRTTKCNSMTSMFYNLSLSNNSLDISYLDFTSCSDLTDFLSRSSIKYIILNNCNSEKVEKLQFAFIIRGCSVLDLSEFPMDSVTSVNNMIGGDFVFVDLGNLSCINPKTAAFHAGAKDSVMYWFVKNEDVIDFLKTAERYEVSEEKIITDKTYKEWYAENYG